MDASLPAAQLIEDLPFGMVMARSDGGLYANAAARRSIEACPDSTAELRARDPALARFVDDAEVPDQILSIGGRNHHVQQLQIGSAPPVALLLPFTFLERLKPGLLQLEQLYNDFQEIFRNSFDGIFIVDGQGKTLMINEGCERNYDLKAEDLIGRHVSVFEKKGWIKPVIGARVIAERRRITELQRTHAGKAIMVTGIPLFDDTGRVRKVIINSRDTTELLALQEELARAQDHLRRMESEAYELRLENLKLAGVVLDSPDMKRIAALAARVAKVDSTILITGESGVGKEIIAKLVHRESHRAEAPFIKINCGAIPAGLLESELFGYEAGAFTGASRQGKLGLVETAGGGTLFLDEVGELPAELQVKLLQLLQDHSFSRVGGTRVIEADVRIVAATNADLEAMVARRAFRSDLYYRLNVVPITIPPLKQRPDDILPLVHLYLDEFNSRYGFSKRLSERASKLLLEHAWPGNVRELRNIIERLVVTTAHELIDADDLPPQILPDAQPASGPDLDYKTRLRRFESQMMTQAIKRYGTTRAAAEHLGISQSTVVRKLNHGAQAQ